MNTKTGFMLIEMLVALVVFCTLAGIATGYIAHAATHIRHAHRMLDAVQRAWGNDLSTKDDALACTLTECHYTQKISSVHYKPLNESLFRLEHLTVVDANNKKTIIFSTLMLRQDMT